MLGLCIYVSVGTVWSLYQGGRGVVEQWHVNGKEYPGWIGVVVLYVHDFAFRAICTAAGFVSLWICDSIAKSVSNWSDVSAGSATLLVGSFIIGVIGVGGQLHYVILLGKTQLP